MKIGFIVQEDWKEVHFGVRNYFSTIASTLAEENIVDYIVYKENVQGENMWYLYNDRADQRNTMQTIEIVIEGQFEYNTYSEIYKGSEKKETKNDKFFRCIGNYLGDEQYDIIVISNPWLVQFDEKLPCKKLVGVVYDLVANKYALSGTTEDFMWAYYHNRGYCYYLKYCDEIFAISELVKKEFNLFYHTDKCKMLSPFPPYAYRNMTNKEIKKEKAIVLAAPFDKRKGMASIPEYLDMIGSNLECVYIYGKPRCSIEDFNHFFECVEGKKIVYYPYITSNDLFDLYRKCMFLLFPSIEEGLGIPIIEAQICGCRVVTTNKDPMRSLVLKGGYFLDGISDQKEMQEMLLNDSFDFYGLREIAQRRFSIRNIYESFVGRALEYV